MFEEQIVFFILQALVWLVAILSLSMIWIYISNKAPGMQTLYDCMVKDLILFSMVSLAGVTLINMDFGGVPPWVAVCLMCFRFWSGMALLNQLLVVIIVRYLSIFNSDVIMELDETKFVKGSRLFACFFALACMVFEFRIDITSRPWYEFLVSGEVNQEEQPIQFYTTLTVVALDILLMVILHVRVELLNHQSPENELFQNGSHDMGTIRAIIICGVLVLVGVVNRVLKSRVRFVLLSFMTYNVIPCIFILRNENMTQYLTSNFALSFNKFFVPAFHRRVAPLP